MKRSRPMLGTFVDIEVDEGGFAASNVREAVEAAYQAVARVGRLMSFHDAASELSRVNAASAGDLVELDAWTVDVLALAQTLHRATGGLFDCGVGDTLVGWGDLPAHAGRVASRGSIADLRIVDARHVMLERAVCLDLGGIAKGYAVDRAIDALAEAGIASAIVNAGGDLRVLGAAPMTIHRRDPRDPRRLKPLGALADGALATSSIAYSGRRDGGEWRSALVDPRDRSAVDSPCSFTVVAPSCAVADGLTKALAIAGALSDDCCARFDAIAIVE